MWYFFVCQKVATEKSQISPETTLTKPKKLFQKPETYKIKKLLLSPWKDISLHEIYKILGLTP